MNDSQKETSKLAYGYTGGIGFIMGLFIAWIAISKDLDSESRTTAIVTSIAFILYSLSIFYVLFAKNRPKKEKTKKPTKEALPFDTWITIHAPELTHTSIEDTLTRYMSECSPPLQRINESMAMARNRKKYEILKASIFAESKDQNFIDYFSYVKSAAIMHEKTYKAQQNSAHNERKRSS